MQLEDLYLFDGLAFLLCEQVSLSKLMHLTLHKYFAKNIPLKAALRQAVL